MAVKRKKERKKERKKDQNGRFVHESSSKMKQGKDFKTLN